MTSSPPPPPLKDHLCSGSSGMDSRLWVSLLWVTLCTALAAPPAEMRSAGAPLRHVRNKRCSCASFLDKECVYFCHLDIIWVNTPERVVSYGLGNAPRAKRAVSMATTRAPRCRCVRESDGGCVSFCLRSQAAAAAVAAGHARRLDAADSDRTGSTRTGHPVRPAALRSVLPVRLIRQTGLLLERRSARRRRRSRAWQSDSTPP